MRRYLCAAPAYLDRRGTPRTIESIAGHDLIAMSAPDGRAKPWTFPRGTERVRVEIKPRASITRP